MQVDHSLLHSCFAQTLWVLVLGWFGCSWVFLGRLCNSYEAWNLAVEPTVAWTCRGKNHVACIFCGSYLGPLEGKKRCFERSSSLLCSFWLICVEFLAVLWVSILPQFEGFPISTMIRNLEEIAFSWTPMCRPQPRWLFWHHHLPGVFKLNFDGSAIGNPGRAGLGRVVRNSKAEPIFSFSGPAGQWSVN